MLIRTQETRANTIYWFKANLPEEGAILVHIYISCGTVNPALTISCILTFGSLKKKIRSKFGHKDPRFGHKDQTFSDGERQ